jgi:crotonobetainyl-CoA:carnitine CoA-transferase CaiB-like acyl-CoA transferase
MYGLALVAIIGVLAALRARVITGEGDRVDVSTRDGVLALMTMNWWNEGRPSFIDARTRTGRLDLGRTRLLLDKFRCADGRLIQVHTGATGAFGRAMEAFGLTDVVTRAEGPVEMATPLTDRDLEVLREDLPSIIASADSSYWLQRLWDHEVACLPVQPPGEVFRDDQVRHAGIMATVADAELGEIEVVGPVISLSRSPAVEVRPRPRVGADGTAINISRWQSDGLGEPQAGRRELQLPLSGVRIVELSNYFASPSGNRLLRDLGADVIKVEPLHGDPIRSLPDPCEGANGGKRSIAIDLKSDRARPVLDRLVASADVIQHNMRPGAAARLGIDEATARGFNPSLVYAYGPGYGSSGPKAKLQSFAPLHSGFVGLMHLAAGEGNEPHTCFGNEDYYAGLLSAVGILLALIHRDRTGEGQGVEVAQLLASVFVTSEHFLHNGTVRSTLPTLDRDQTGWSPTYRIYQCLEGWLCVSCVDAGQVDRFRSTIELDTRMDDDDVRATAAQDVLFGRRADEWRAVLRSADVPCEIVREEAWLGEFLTDKQNLASGASVEFIHPQLGRARVIGSFIHLARRGITRSGRAPVVGEHTGAVLQELGFTSEQAASLEEVGVTRQGQAPLQ